MQNCPRRIYIRWNQYSFMYKNHLFAKLIIINFANKWEHLLYGIITLVDNEKNICSYSYISGDWSFS